MQGLCASCGHENRASARFCESCGSRLALTCDECGTELRPGTRFCDSCGHPVGTPAAPAPREYTPKHLAQKIEAAGAELAGERKQVTVLFADVARSMDLAASVDSELWRGVMDRFLGVICDGVHRFEGTVNKFTGDGAMALFGAPIAHEDHASRACHAALHLRDSLAAFGRELQAEHGLDFAVRLGLNSGEVVVGSVGDDLHMDYTALGHTVGLAARMESLAQPGLPYMTRSTAALVEGYFELEDVGELEVKGVSEPVRTYALLGAGSARGRLDARGEAGLSGFVGREAELAALDSALERSSVSGQVVGVVAEAGLGKSRLCHEFAERCRARGIQVTVGAGVAHGDRVPLLPVIEMLRRYFDVHSGDGDEAARAKIRDRLLELDPGFGAVLPVLFDFLGVSDPERPSSTQMLPEARERALFAALTRLVQARSAEAPGVILVEDLHWLDPGSDAFLANLVESLPGARTLVLVNFRPEYRADWMQKSYYQQVPLVPLGTDAVADLVADLIGTDPSLDGVAELIAERTSGNPFFIEEVVQRLVEIGSFAGTKGAYRLAHSIDAIEIPATVQAVLAARIDRLGAREKRVLQAASVIGREFSERVLRRVTGIEPDALADALRTLSAAELVYERTRFPEPGFAFKHPLTEEVAYRSQLGDRRARTHARVAEAIEAAYPDRLGELAGVIGNHWEQAGDSTKAADWIARAALWAGQNHPADALRHWRRVRTLAGTNPERAHLALGACMWMLQFGWRLGMPLDEIQDLFADGRGLADETGNRWALAALHASHAVSLGMSGDIRGALRLMSEARELAEQSGDPRLRLTFSIGYWLALAGRLEEALADLDHVIAAIGDDFELGRETVGFSTRIWSEMFRGVVLCELGRLPEARAALERGIELGREHDDVESLGWALCLHGLYAWLSGEVEGIPELVDEGMAIAHRLGGSFSLGAAHYNRAQLRIAQEDWAGALAAADTSVTIYRDARTGVQYAGAALALKAIAVARLGRRDDAEAVAREALELCKEIGTPTAELHSLLALGLALRDTDHAAAVAALDEVRTRGEQLGHPIAGLACVALADASEGEERVGHLEAARKLFAQQGATGHLRRVDEKLARSPA